MTSREHPETAQFMALLDAIDLPRLYYGFTDRDRGVAAAPPGDLKADHMKVLREVGIPVEYDARERSFRHEVVEGDERWQLVMSFHEGFAPTGTRNGLASDLEICVFVETPRGTLGGPVHGLALDVAKRRAPKKLLPSGLVVVLMKDRYPRLDYTTTGQMREAVVFAHELFVTIKKAWSARC